MENIAKGSRKFRRHGYASQQQRVCVQYAARSVRQR